MFVSNTLFKTFFREWFFCEIVFDVVENEFSVLIDVNLRRNRGRWQDSFLLCGGWLVTCVEVWNFVKSKSGHLLLR